MNNFFPFPYHTKLNKKSNIRMNNKNIFLATFLIFISIVLAACLIIPSGCKNKFSKLLSYGVTYIPKNLDPQTACDSTEITVISNVFDGLFKRTQDGSFELCAAQTMEKNIDGTEVSFSIKPGNFWKFNPENKSLARKLDIPVTAQDFEFAFKRLLNPSTNSPFAKNYYFIKNAQAVHEGNLSPNELGVKCINNKLIIQLQHPTPNLEELLSLTPTMPCNENFFKSTNGRYGLNTDTLMCNGKFYVHQWPHNQKNKKIRLRVNDKNPDSHRLNIIGVNLSYRTDHEAFKLISKNELDSAIFNSAEYNFNQINSTTKQFFQNSTTGIIFNKNNILFKNEKILQAMALSTNHEAINQLLDKNYMTKAWGIIPNSATLAGKKFNKLKNNEIACPSYDPKKAKELFNAGLNEIQPKKNKNQKIDLNNFSILVNENYYNVVNEILQNWQKDLNLYLKIKTCPPEEYLNNLQNNNFDCALITLENTTGNLSKYFDLFLDNKKIKSNSQTDPFNSKLNALINNAINSTNLEQMTQNYFAIEKEIVGSGNFIPIYHPTNVFLLNKNFKDVYLVENCRQLLFEFAKPKK